MEKMTYSIEDLREHYKEIIKLRNKLIYLVAKQEYTPDRKFLDKLPADLPSSVSDFLTRASAAYNDDYGSEDKYEYNLQRREEMTTAIDNLLEAWENLVAYIPANAVGITQMDDLCKFSNVYSAPAEDINIKKSTQRQKQLNQMIQWLTQAQCVAQEILKQYDIFDDSCNTYIEEASDNENLNHVENCKNDVEEVQGELSTNELLKAIDSFNESLESIRETMF